MGNTGNKEGNRKETKENKKKKKHKIKEQSENKDQNEINLGKDDNKKNEESAMNDKKKEELNYDIWIKIVSLYELLKGWNIEYGKKGLEDYLYMKNKEVLLIGLLGLKNSGKSFILSKLLNKNISKKEETDNLYLKYMINAKKNINLAFIDTPGLGRSLKKCKNYSIKELEKFNIQTDNFLTNFILKKSNIVICVVGNLNFNEQKLLNKLKIKDEEYKKEYNELKKLFIIHNLKDLSTKEEVDNYINKVLFESISFKLNELETQSERENENTKYFIESNDDKEMQIYHFIVAKENSEAGNYYNESTYTMIIQKYNSFNYKNKSFDLVNEIKEEIQSISKKIFTKSITSLDDFEKIETKIKLKNEFEFLNNTDENLDFSYLSLKPKYSYFKINNNSQLLIIIEMPGQIIDCNFVCNQKPKNGFYIMTFSGKKITNIPENLEDQKKDGLFYTNIEDGEFEEIIKINIEKFQLKSNKYSSYKFENNGIYKYYFDLIKDDSFLSDYD